ncbi:MAG: hypothetical protein ACRD1E_04015 [Terriglobales bacterium]
MAKGKGVGLVVMMGRPGGGGDDGPMPPERRRQHAADVEASFLGRPQPHGTYDAESDGGRVSAETAGYMELDGAAKDGDCDLVTVPGGVSGARGCCNLFAPEGGAQAFDCADCEHFSAQAAPASQAQGAPAAGQDAQEAMNG